MPTLSWSAYVLPQTTITTIPTTRRLKRLVIFFMSVFCSFQANQWKNNCITPSDMRTHSGTFPLYESVTTNCITNTTIWRRFYRVDRTGGRSVGRSVGRCRPRFVCSFVRSSLAALSLSRRVRCRWRWRVGPGLFFPCRLRRGTNQTVVQSSRHSSGDERGDRSYKTQSPSSDVKNGSR
jgi:hypothetical protein